MASPFGFVFLGNFERPILTVWFLPASPAPSPFPSFLSFISSLFFLLFFLSLFCLFVVVVSCGAVSRIPIPYRTAQQSAMHGRKEAAHLKVIDRHAENDQVGTHTHRKTHEEGSDGGAAG